MPVSTNPAEYMLSLANKDFIRDRGVALKESSELREAWLHSPQASRLVKAIGVEKTTQSHHIFDTHQTPALGAVLLALLHRSYIKTYRDILAYGIRAAMYLSLAVMIGNVWVRLTPDQSNIENYINCIFFGTSFMSFMAVAYVPAYLEDRSLFIKERANGLYGPTAFMVANFLAGHLPLFLITLIFSIVTYWLVDFRPGANGFFYYVMWLFLDLLAAESLVVLFANVFPVFIVALATVAFANGLWMIVEGYMVRPSKLNPFWRYVFHYIDYLAYVFQGMMVNEFAGRSYNCARNGDGSCDCMYDSLPDDECRVSGKSVLEGYGYDPDKRGQWVAILICIIVAIRLMSWGALYVKNR